MSAVPESVLLYKKVIDARVVARRAEAEYVAARDRLAELEAEYRTVRVEHVA